jgi:hypothetical protein
MYGKHNNWINSIVISISATLMSALMASCGGGAAIDAEPEAANDYMPPPVSRNPELADEIAQGDERSASYTPGVNCAVPGGIFMPDIFNYCWKINNVTEHSGPKYVELDSAMPAYKARVKYIFEEPTPGRMQKITIRGSGTLLTAYLFNWKTLLYDNFGTYKLDAGPINLIVLPDYSTPGNLTNLKLVQEADASSRITSIVTNVY